MLFGATPFANSPFGDPGGVTVFVTVTGNRVNVDTGSIGIVGAGRVLPNGSGVEISIGNATAVIGQTVGVTGVRINLATGTASVISWNPIVPGATGTWVPIDPDNP